MRSPRDPTGVSSESEHGTGLERNQGAAPLSPSTITPTSNEGTSTTSTSTLIFPTSDITPRSSQQDTQPSLAIHDISPANLIQRFLYLTKAKKIVNEENCFTFDSEFSKILSDFQKEHPELWQAIAEDLRYDLYSNNILVLKMPESLGYSGIGGAIGDLIRSKAIQSCTVPGTTSDTVAFAASIDPVGTCQLPTGLNGSSFQPDEQLYADGDSFPSIVIEVASSQGWFGFKGLAHKLSNHIVTSHGLIKFAIGICIDKAAADWDPNISVAIPYISTSNGTRTLRHSFTLEQVPLIIQGTPAAGALDFTLLDLVSNAQPNAVLSRFPGLQVNMRFSISFAEIVGIVSRMRRKETNQATSIPNPHTFDQIELPSPPQAPSIRLDDPPSSSEGDSGDEGSEYEDC